jgi:hypothetical protein
MALGLAFLVFGTACAGIWTRVDEKQPRPFQMPTLEIEANLPLEWYSATYMPLVGGFLFTKHGRTLEEIWLRRWAKGVTWAGTNRAISDGMTVQDISQLAIDTRRMDDNIGSIQVLSNVPARVDGRECYRLDVRYRDSIGLARRTAEYGCVVGNWIYRFEFMAPSQHYFESHLNAFEEIIESVRFKVKGA